MYGTFKDVSTLARDIGDTKCKTSALAEGFTKLTEALKQWKVTECGLRCALELCNMRIKR